jgi:serine O-acetyltransferase
MTAANVTSAQDAAADRPLSAGSAVAPTWSQTLDAIRRDLVSYCAESPGVGLWTAFFSNLYRHPSLAGVLYYRIGRWFWCRHTHLLARVMLAPYWLLYPVVRSYGGLELSPRASIGPGLCVLHFGPTIIHPDVIAGSNLTLLPGAIIGKARTGVPRLGDSVTVGSGAVIVGGIVIGNNVSIGARAVVARDLPDFMVIPALGR